jgi:hypothetical protein
MAAHKGPASIRPRCTRGGSSVAAIPVYPSDQVLHITLILFYFCGKNELYIFSSDTDTRLCCCNHRKNKLKHTVAPTEWLSSVVHSSSTTCFGSLYRPSSGKITIAQMKRYTEGQASSSQLKRSGCIDCIYRY